MNIALLQCDVQTGDLINNREILLASAIKAGENGTELCIAPIEILAGPNPGDWIKQKDFFLAGQQTLDYIAQHLPENLVLICGLPIFPDMAIIIKKHLWTALPQVFYLNKQTIYLDNGRGDKPDYSYDANALIVKIKAYPFAPARQEEEEENCCNLAKEKRAWVLQPNLFGGYGDLVYAGASFVANPEGKISARANAFKEDILLFDTCQGAFSKSPFPDPDEAQWRALCTGIRDYVNKSGANKVIIGLSGGMDSALVTCLARDALNADKVIPVMLPSPFSSAGSISDSILLCENLGINVFSIPVEKIMESCNAALDPVFSQLPAQKEDLTQENLQPRIRSLLLMAIANRCGGLVLNTGNKSESLMGYSTLYGDTAGAISVLGDLFKSRIYELAEWYNKKNGWAVIPVAILQKAPSAELRPNQKDTDSLPPYDTLDPVLAEIIKGQIADENYKKEIRNKVFQNQFKRSQSPRPLKVSQNAIPDWPLLGNYHID